MVTFVSYVSVKCLGILVISEVLRVLATGQALLRLEGIADTPQNCLARAQK